MNNIKSRLPWLIAALSVLAAGYFYAWGSVNIWLRDGWQEYRVACWDNSGPHLFDFTNVRKFENPLTEHANAVIVEVEKNWGYSQNFKVQDGRVMVRNDEWFRDFETSGLIKVLNYHGNKIARLPSENRFGTSCRSKGLLRIIEGKPQMESVDGTLRYWLIQLLRVPPPQDEREFLNPGCADECRKDTWDKFFRRQSQN